MKPHIIIKLKDKINSLGLRYWEDIIEDKKDVKKTFYSPVDKIIREKYKIDFFPTLNYKPKDEEWSLLEKKNQLNQIFRLVLLTDEKVPKNMIDEISLKPEVSYVKLGEIAQSNIPDKDYSGAQSFSSKYASDYINLKQAHYFTKGHPEISIAVLDTGIDMYHYEFDNTFLHPKDFVNIIDGAQKFVGDFLGMDDVPDDIVGHGTHVAGIIASKGKKMPLGVAPYCKIIPVRVLGALKNDNKIVGAGLIDDIDAGIKYAVDMGADIINMSLGIKHIGGGLPHESVINYALDNNVTIVAASGNDGLNDKYYPGALEGVIAVGACDMNGNAAQFSTYGKHVSVSAPGVNVYSSYLNNGYVLSSGTSQASPYVSGTISLLKSYALEKKGKKLKNEFIKEILFDSCDKSTALYKDEKMGFGKINTLDALKLLKYRI